jgi:hypothetical protein
MKEVFKILFLFIPLKRYFSTEILNLTARRPNLRAVFSSSQDGQGLPKQGGGGVNKTRTQRNIK